MRIFRIVAVACAITLTGCIMSPPPRLVHIDPAMAAFEHDLKTSITDQTVDSLSRRSLAERGFLLVQFHYLDGKITDADGVYLLGEKHMVQDVIQQLMQVQVPPPIPEIAGKRIRFFLSFCFMDREDCDEREKRAMAAVKPEPDDLNGNSATAN